MTNTERKAIKNRFKNKYGKTVYGVTPWDDDIIIAGTFRRVCEGQSGKLWIEVTIDIDKSPNRNHASMVQLWYYDTIVPLVIESVTDTLEECRILIGKGGDVMPKYMLCAEEHIFYFSVYTSLEDFVQSNRIGAYVVKERKGFKWEVTKEIRS